MTLWFDIEPDAIVEHDDWHTHEHFPERLSIPGFRRGSRWVAASGSPRYFVLYEVAETGVLVSQPYLDRLNNPTPWTRKMMPTYRGMTRGLCSVSASSGLGLGHAALTIRFSPGPGNQVALRDRLADLLPSLCMRPGVVSAHLLEAAAAAPMTAEQRIRGKDSGVDRVLVITGYDDARVGALQEGELSAATLEEHGAAAGCVHTIHRLALTLTESEAKA